MAEHIRDCGCEEHEHAIHLDRRTFMACGAAVVAGVAGAVALQNTVGIPGLVTEEEIKPVQKAYDENTAKLTFIVNSAKCIGCGLCVQACKTENLIPLETEFNRTWIERHIRTSDGEVHIDAPAAGINGYEKVPQPVAIAGKKVDAEFFVPRLCMQCENPPCVGVCPVSATYATPEGVVLIDESRCIGCGYCVTACPYGARYVMPAADETPLGVSGVADKCTWCFHRITRGLKPACVEVCPTGARQFGNAADAADPINKALAEQPEPLWPEYETKPRLFYLGPSTEEA